MGSSLSAEEVRQKHMKALGPKLGSVYDALWEDVAQLHLKWKQYKSLYTTSPERRQLLDRIAAHFFIVIEVVLRDDIILHLARLTDPARSNRRKHRHLSLDSLPPLLLADEGAKSVHKEVSRLITAVKRQSRWARDWRNQYLAHRDLSVAIAQRKGMESLPRIRLEDMEAAFDAVSAVFNKIAAHYWNGAVRFELFHAPADAELLLQRLQALTETKSRPWRTEGTGG